MEESKLRTHRRSSVGAGRPLQRGKAGAPAASSHVIDLRATKADVPPAVAPAKTPRSKPKPRRRPPAAPNQSAVPVAQSAPAADTRPAAAPLGPAPIAAAAAEPTLPPRRFWPAFWRFLLLLVILGLLVIGGVYLYINYYRG